MKNLKERFESKIFYSPDGCWYWLADLNEFGYGRININGVIKLAHRISFQLYRGDISKPCVCHTCDNPACVNPNHLFLGDHQDNMTDRQKKNRSNPRIGEKHPNAILTESQVRQIRSLRGILGSKEISEKMNLKFRTVDNILYNKRTWSHIQ